MKNNEFQVRNQRKVKELSMTAICSPVKYIALTDNQNAGCRARVIELTNDRVMGGEDEFFWTWFHRALEQA